VPKPDISGKFGGINGCQAAEPLVFRRAGCNAASVSPLSPTRGRGFSLSPHKELNGGRTLVSMRLFSLDTKLKRGLRAAYWRGSLLSARVSGHPSYAFFDQQVRQDAWRLGRIAVLPERDIVFLPIPKNANSKTRRVLAEVRGVQNPFTTNPKKKFRKSLTARDISIQQFYRLLHSKNRLSFAIVRDPYDRILSAWWNKFRGRPLVPGLPLQKGARELKVYLGLRESIDPSLPAGPDSELGFDDFLTYVAAIIGKQIDPHIETQTSFLDVPFVPIDHMVRLESYAQDMMPVLAQLKAPDSLAARLGDKVNASGTGKKEFVITPAQKKKIEALYGEDIERFGYRR
jgi:hypothetical protein